MVARGERPMYRFTDAADGSWSADLPGVSGTAATRREALDAARAAIAAMLEVEPDAFDLEA